MSVMTVTPNEPTMFPEVHRRHDEAASVFKQRPADVADRCDLPLPGVDRVHINEDEEVIARRTMRLNRTFPPNYLCTMACVADRAHEPIGNPLRSRAGAAASDAGCGGQPPFAGLI